MSGPLKDFILDKDKRKALIVIAGLVGMVLIALSGFMGGTSGSAKAGAIHSDELLSTAAYAKEVEQSLLSVLGQIEGVGELEVLVTMETTYEQVYAQTGKSSSSAETTYDSSGQETKVQSSENSEHAYVLIDASGGKREALLITQIEPKIKGVVVVCQGADNMVVQERVISAVTTALGINSHRVCVIKKA